MHRAQSHDGEHRDDRLRDHRHVHRDAVAGLHAEFAQRIGGLCDHLLQLRVGDGSRFALGVTDPVVGDLVALAGLDVTIDAVVRRVERAVGEPRGVGQVPLQTLARGGGPRQSVGLLAPPGNRIGVGFVVERRLRVRLLGELGTRCEAARLVKPRFEFRFSHCLSRSAVPG
jgi:hypothetical protein